MGCSGGKGERMDGWWRTEGGEKERGRVEREAKGRWQAGGNEFVDGLGEGAF